MLHQKKESQASIIKAFEKYLEDNGNNKYHYIHVHPVYYVINGKKLMYEEEVIRDDKIKELEKMAILFSEYYHGHKKVTKKEAVPPMYEPIKDGEVRFSLLFKEFAEKGIIPKDYIYDKVREYMVELGIITMEDMESNGVPKRVTFVTESALDKKILRIVGCKRYGDSFTYSYVFTVEGIDYMRKLFSDFDENKKLELFTYMNVA